MNNNYETEARRKQQRLENKKRKDAGAKATSAREQPVKLRSTKQISACRFSVTTFDGFTGTRPVKEWNDVPWGQAAHLIRPQTPVFIADKRDGQFIVPCPLKEAPLVGNTLDAAIKSSQPTTGKMRSKQHVTEAAMLVIDIDGLAEVAFEAGLAKMKVDGLTFVAFTTHSHGSEDKPGVRARIVIPLDHPVDTAAYAAAWHGFDQRYWNGQVAKADSSGANMYQQQGTWCCHPDRVEQAQSWENCAGVASADALIAIGNATVVSRGAQSNTAEKSAKNIRIFPCTNQAAGSDYPDSDANKVADACPQIGAFREAKGAGQSEPCWRDSLGIVGHCKNGENFCQEWSSGHPGYDERKTAEKLTYRMQTPPTTCAQFQKSNPDGCRGCAQQCNSPITLGWAGREEFKVVPFEVVDATPEASSDAEPLNAGDCPQFERGETVIVNPDQQSDSARKTTNPLDKFSLRGMSDELEKSVVNSVLFLGLLALLGQVTAFFAAPNTGKTLIAISLIIDAIKEGRVDPSKIYYLNMDDTSQGLLEKLRVAEEYNFHMLAEGHLDFTARAFLDIVRNLTETDQASGVVIILDTLKKFVDLMDKKRTSDFTNVIRSFVTKGGTVIALAHTNKKLGQDGKPVYGGVSDTLNDIDCAYTIAQVSAQDGTKVVEFANIKRRGNVVESAAYSYCVGNGIPYNEILLSVQPFDQSALQPLKQAEEIKSDAEVIAAVTGCINDGVITKMKLAKASAERAKISQRIALQIIEKYTGTDPALHRWNFGVRDRGAKVFALLEAAPSVPTQEVLAT